MLAALALLYLGAAIWAYGRYRALMTTIYPLLALLLVTCCPSLSEVGNGVRSDVMSHSGLWRSRRRIRLLIAVASPVIVIACRGSKEQPTPSAESRNAEVERLQKVINETGVVTTGVARGVRLIRDGKDLTARLGTELREGDRIVTDSGTRAVIGSEAGPQISLGR